MRLQPVFKIVNNHDCPMQLQSYMNFRSELCGGTQEIHLPKVKSAIGQSTFKFPAGNKWSTLTKDRIVG